MGKGDEVFGAILKAALIRMGKSAAQLARDVGVSPTTVGKWISGKDFPKPERWNGIKFHAGVDPRDSLSAEIDKVLADYEEEKALIAPPNGMVNLKIVPSTPTAIITQTAERAQAIANSPGTYSGLGDVMTTSGDQPPPAGMITMDLYHPEAEAIEKLRGMAITSRGMFFKAIELYSVVENKLMLLDFVAKLMEEHERYMHKTGQ